MAYRFLRLGTTPNWAGPNDWNPGALVYAAAPAPSVVLNDDQFDWSNLDVASDSDPVYVGGLTEGAVWVYSDVTSTASIRVKGGPTPTGPWVILDGGAIANPALATPTVVDVFASSRPEYIIVTTASWSAGNPRALFVGKGY